MGSPNILILFSDQHRADFWQGEMPGLPTPNLSRLARRGVTFRRAYCQNGICVASRNSFMTGLYPRTLGVQDNDDRGVALETRTPMQQFFRGHGYETFTSGKRHLLGTLDQGWDVSFGALKDERSGQGNYHDFIRDRGLTGTFERDWNAEVGFRLPGNQAAPLAVQVSELPEDATMEAWSADQTIRFIESRRAHQKPFFAWTTFLRPHQPYTPLPHWMAKARSLHLPLPDSLREDPANLPPMLQTLRGQTAKPWNLGDAAKDERLYRDYVDAYAALVMEIDHHIGRILDALERKGILEDTVVLYTSDHGDFVGAHGMVEKAALGHNIYEETLRVPLIISHPAAFPMGIVRQDLVGLVDIFPTLCDSTKFGAPGTLEGISLAAPLRKGIPVPRDYLVSENHSQRTLIGRKYKYGNWLPFPKRDYRAFGPMLFDLEADPGESRNLSKTSRGAEIIQGLQETWEKTSPSL